MKSPDDTKAKTASSASEATDPHNAIAKIKRFQEAQRNETPLILDDKRPGLDKKTLAKLFDFSDAGRPFKKFPSTKLWQLLKKSESKLELIKGLAEVQRPGIDEAHARSLQAHADALSDYKREIIGELLGRRVSRKKVDDLRKALGTEPPTVRPYRATMAAFGGLNRIPAHTDRGVTESNAAALASPPELMAPNARASNRQMFLAPILQQKGWSKLEFATHAGVDYNTIVAFLKGKTKPRQYTRMQLANALEVKLADFPE